MFYFSPHAFNVLCFKKGAAYPAHFSELGQHYNNSGVVLPEHSPEVLCGLCQWSLCGNVGFLLPAEKDLPW